MAELNIDLDEDKKTENSASDGANIPTAPETEAPDAPAAVATTGKIRSKKPLIVILILLLIGGAVGAYFMFFSKDKTATNSPATTKTTTTTEAKTKTELLVYQDPSLYAVSGTEKRLLATVEPGSRALRYVVDSKGAGTFYYATVDDNAYYTAVKKSDGKTSSDVYTIPKPEVNTALSVSADGKLIATTTDQGIEEGGPLGAVLKTEIISANDGSKKTVATDENKLYRAIDFAAGGKLILQELTCWGCDGPPKATAAVVDTTTGKVTKEHALASDGSTSADLSKSGDVFVSPDKDEVILIASSTKYSMGATNADREADIFKVSRVNVLAGTSDVIFKKADKTEMRPDALGFNIKEDKFYFQVHTVEGSSEASIGKFNKVIEIGKGSKSDINLEFTTLKNGGYISQLYSLDGKTIYIVLNTGQGVANKQSLTSIPYTEADAKTTNIFEPSDKGIKIVGTLTTKE